MLAHRPNSSVVSFARGCIYHFVDPGFIVRLFLLAFLAEHILLLKGLENVLCGDVCDISTYCMTFRQVHLESLFKGLRSVKHARITTLRSTYTHLVISQPPIAGRSLLLFIRLIHNSHLIILVNTWQKTRWMRFLVVSFRRLV